jgi:hypothetical protein
MVEENSMIDVVIFSKDRAAQLDMMLSGLKHYFANWSTQKYTVLFTHSNDLHKLAYDRVKSLHQEKCFTWVKESNFYNDTKNIFNSGKNPLVSFLVDDDVFIDHFSLDSYEFKTFMDNSQIACLSPRIAPYTTYCYTARISTPPPKIFIGDTIWNWKDPELAGDWNYPMSIASFHIFRREDLVGPINTVPFRGPNSFEGTCLAPNPPHHRQLMMSYKRCKIICGVNNRVQVENNNFHEGTDDISILAKELLLGKRFNPKANNLLVSNACHGPVKLQYL